MTVFSVVAGLVAVGYWYWTAMAVRAPPSAQKPEPPKFHCPEQVVYVPMDGNPFRIDAAHADHPATTQYEWDVVDAEEATDLLVDGEDTASLLLIKSDPSVPATVGVELS